MSSERPQRSLLNLPAELLLDVCGLVDIPSLKGMRLINKTFGVLGAKVLFEEVHVTLLPDSISKVRSIMGDKTINQHVRRLSYLAQKIDAERLLNFEAWKEYALHASTDELAPSYTASYHRFQYLAQFQSNLMSSGYESQLMEAMLCCFQGLQEIQLVDYDAFIPEENSDSESEEDDDPSSFLPLITNLVQQTLLPPAILFSYNYTRSYQSKALLSYLEALCRGAPCPPELIISDLDMSYWHHKLDLLTVGSHISNGIKPSFSAVTMLELSVKFDITGRKSHDDSEISRFCNFLLSAPHLSRLWLTMDLNSDEGGLTSQAGGKPHRVNISQILKSVPLLKHLGLTRCMLDLNTFKNFLRRVRGSLKFVLLEDIWLEAQPLLPKSMERVPSACLWEEIFTLMGSTRGLQYEFQELEDEWIESKIREGNQHGLDPRFLSSTYMNELALYTFHACRSKRHYPLPIPCEPRVLDTSSFLP